MIFFSGRSFFGITLRLTIFEPGKIQGIYNGSFIKFKPCYLINKIGYGSFGKEL